MKLNIRAKILGGFSIILIIMVLASGLAMTGISTVEKEYGVVVNKNLPVSQLVWKIRAKNFEQVASIRAYMIYKDKKYTDKFYSINEELGSIYDNIESLIETDSSKEMLNQIKEAHSEYKKVAKEVFNLVDNGDLEKAIEVGEKGTQYVQIIQNLTDEWIEWVNQYNNQIKADTNKLINNRKVTNFIVVTLAFIISLIIGISLNRNISNPLIDLKTYAGTIANGDLTKHIAKKYLKRKDEIGDLSTALSNMQVDIKNLIKKVKSSSSDVSHTSSMLSDISNQTSTAVSEVARAVEDIAQSASQQATDLETGSSNLNKLASSIETVLNDTYKMNNASNSMNELSNTGLNKVNTLVDKTKISQKAANQISEIILNMNNLTKEISTITDTITGISEQTNLLALNAAIEAARAGESGQGFAVVAEEVRKLAEQAAAEAESVKKIIENIQNQAESAVNTMGEVSNITKEQDTAVAETEKIFKDISSSIRQLSNLVHEVKEHTDDMKFKKDEIVDMINNISALSQQTSATTEEVSASTEEQLATVEEMSSQAEMLNELAKNLFNDINKFKV
ncbi:methyl-accepting chemotaxis protein [Caldisalinibacter kiritimatiensis]|uniref:Methyl-accepting chemotaxis protein n=1 Tax=Caldisalinibacter kiritimatiensis TaxID=1304284 RepID=R1CV60_9FIRM|nr:methyl-accepting chemotaxis protein [Caldisalinibacter kiritimatiensis]EOD00514.1 Methyl-accepting chemotaxis protein [Caldisalinibacter kiritimatiensis]